MPIPLGLGAIPTLRPDDQPQGGERLSPVIIQIEGGEEPKTSYDEKTRTLKIEQPDGAAIFLLDQDPPKDTDAADREDWFRNLAEDLSDGERGRIVEELLQAVDADDQSRQDWLKTRAQGIEMLGFRLEEPRSESGLSSAPLEGMSVVRHPLLPEAVIRFQANATAELLPSSGPVKVRNTMPPTPTASGAAGSPVLPLYDAVPGAPAETMDDLAEALEMDFNAYLTNVDKGYYTDTARMLFGVGFGGCGFKKIYHDPIKRRPVSRSVDAKDLIVSNEAVDLEDAGRITHRIIMRKSLVRRMQLSGAYRDVPLGEPQLMPNEVDTAVAASQGIADRPHRAEDTPYTIDEVYCELDVRGFEHKDGGKTTGLALPYKVSIDRSNRVLLEMRRNWDEDDDTHSARRVFVKYSFVPALGFYDIGLLQIIGNADRALTAAWREMLDAGMFSVFPGLLLADQAGRQFTNQIRIPPGGAYAIKTNGLPIQQIAMPLPYKEPSMAMMQLIQHIEQLAQRVGGTAELPIGEGRQDAPVGTTLALIEQATKVIASVHIRLHAAQAEEFQLLKERFQEDPEAFWRHNKRPARKWEMDQFLEALDNCHLVPAADPNMPSHMHRIMKAVAIKQMQAMNPALYDAKAVDARVLRMIGFENPEELFAENPMVPPAPGAPPPDPAKMAALQLKAQAQQQEQASRAANLHLQADAQAHDLQMKAQIAATESADRAADRAGRAQVAQIRIEGEKMKMAHEAARDQAHEQAKLEHGGPITDADGIPLWPKPQPEPPPVGGLS